MFHFVLSSIFVAFNIITFGFLVLSYRAKVQVNELTETIPIYTVRSVRIAARDCLGDAQTDVSTFRFIACISFALSILVPAFCYVTFLPYTIP